MKTVIGWLFCVVDIIVLGLGVTLVFVGLGLLGSGTGQGTINIILENLGEITGINGHLVVFLAGVLIAAAALGYAGKAFKSAVQWESGPQDTPKHFYPFQS